MLTGKIPTAKYFFLMSIVNPFTRGATPPLKRSTC